MRKFLLLAACVFISLAWLLPIHYRPWVTFTGELYAFLSLFALAALFFNKKLYVPSISIPLFLLALIPLVQWCFGEVFFFSKALMCSLYILGFWFSIIIGFNLSFIKNPEEIFKGVSVVFFICGTLTGIVAICQWLGLDGYLPGMANLKSSRPYANFAQPNNMATFLIMALFATFYISEKNFFKKWFLVVCATIMLFAIVLSQSRTSWIVAFFILFVFLIYLKKGLLKIKWYKLLSWFGLYIIFIITLPLLNNFINQTINLSVVNTESALERATSGHLRIWIWLQMLYAISDQPSWGYGWHQTSVAQMLVSEYYRVPAWLRSAHNFILDFLVWNGLVLGIPYLLYFSYWGGRLISNIKSLEHLIAVAMLSAILIHSMFEFPLFYSYFLLPFGFLIGFISYYIKNKKIYELSPIFLRSNFIVGAFLLLLICRDYFILVPKLNESIQYEKKPELIFNNNKIYILDEFDFRINWIRLDPRTKIDTNQILDIERMILNYPTTYDLIKYARLLAFNGYEKEARHQLWRLKHIRKVNVEYNSLFHYR